MNDHVKTNPKKFWSFINSKKNSDLIPSTMIYNESTLSDPKDIINGFATHFAESFKNLNTSTDLGCSSLNINVLNINCITEDEVYAAIKILKPKMTSGPDQIPAFIIRDCINVFVQPLTTIFNIIIKTCTFPEQWKISGICPVYKKGSKTMIENYRPIAIICNFAKVFVFFQIIFYTCCRQISMVLSEVAPLKQILCA